MPNTIEESFKKLLVLRQEQGNLRFLNNNSYHVDFYSNDYLGFATDNKFKKQIIENINACDFYLNGSAGSRLISGNHSFVTQFEVDVAQLHSVEAALFFHSGYNANLSLFSCITTKHDTIIVDELIHRSVHDGIRLSNATKWKFKHNDLNHLEHLLKKAKGNCFVAVESLYSMEGDFAPLEALVALSQQYNAALIVDEAHAFGVFGLGKVSELKLQNEVFATLVTYGKALGAEGACILGSKTLKHYLINYASPFIYTTATSVFQVLKVKEGYQYLEETTEKQIKLQQNIMQFRSFELNNGASDCSPIQTVFFENTLQLDRLTTYLQQSNFGVYAIKSPTVSKDRERLRICLHAFNTESQILKLTHIIQEFSNE